MSPSILIDDTNPSIQYSVGWFEINGTQNNTGSYGPPFQHTLHGAAVDVHFSFPFSGSSILVYGTSITIKVSGSQDPSWECFIDNTSIGSNPASPTSENNWVLCGGGFPDGLHVLTVKANVSDGQAFWFDHIQYDPSASVSLNQSLLRIDSNDSAIQYSSGWEFFLPPITYTQFNMNSSVTPNNGSYLTYQFYGTSISWYGTNQYTDEAYGFGNAAYSVDGLPPTSFTVGSPNTDLDLYTQMFFEIKQLTPGQHELVVTYFGNNATLPLILNYFVQQDASSSNSSSRKPTDAIIGGVIGGLVLISLLLLALFFNRRRNNRRTVPVATPFPVATSPENYTSNGQFLPSQFPSGKSFHTDYPASTSSRRGIRPLTPLRPQFSSPAFFSPAPLTLTGSQTSLNSTRARVPQAAMEHLVQRPLTPQRADANFILHQDSGVRISSAERIELPPFYTPG